MNKWARILIGLAVFAVVLVASASMYMLDYSLMPLHRSRAEGLQRLYERAPLTKAWVDSVVENKILHDTTIALPDGTYRHGYYMAADSATCRTAVLVHGYKDCAISMLHLGYMYQHDMGYNIVLPDLWAHGKSKGDFIGMGWKERLEVIEWARVASCMFGNDSSSTSIVLHGVSMGAATVMNVSGESLPPHIKAIVEDCGYTSAWDEFSGQLKEQFGLPEFPLMYTTSALCKMKYGWSFGECSPVTQVAHARIPMLFIHGDNDDFVPTAMVHKVYAAHPGPKELWLAPGSAHARSYSDHPVEYTQRVKAFLGKYIH